MKVQLAVCLQDPEYAGRICRYLQKKGADRLEVRCIDAATVPERMEILLTDTERIRKETGNAIFMGTVEEAGRLAWDGPRIDPYTGGPRLLAQCMEQVRRINEEATGAGRLVPQKPEPVPAVLDVGREVQNAGGRIIALFAPSGGAGTSTLAMTLVDQWAARGRKVLYLDLESLSAWRLYYRSESAYNLSDFLYHMLLDPQAAEQMPERLRAMATRQSRGMYFIEPCNGSEDLKVLDAAELQLLFQVLRQVFDVVVCDLDACFGQLQLTVLEESDLRIFVRAALDTGRVKWEDFVAALRRRHADGLLQDPHSLHVRIGASAKEKKVPDLWDLPLEKDLFQEKEGIQWLRQQTDWYKKAGHLLTEVERRAGL